MLLTIVLLLLLQLLAVPVALLAVRRYVERKQAEIESRLAETVRNWLTSSTPEQPSELAKVVAAMGEVIGSAAARSLTAQFGASQSHVARQANALADAGEAQLNPVMALLTGSKRGRGAALMRLGEVLGQFLGKGNTPTGGDGQKPSQHSFTL